MATALPHPAGLPSLYAPSWKYSLGNKEAAVYDQILHLYREGRITSFRPFGPDPALASDSLGIMVDEMLDGRMAVFEISEIGKFLDAELAKAAAPIDLTPKFEGSLMRLPYQECWLEWIFDDRDGPKRVGVAAVSVPERPNTYFLMPVMLRTFDGGLSFNLNGGDAAVNVELDSQGLFSGAWPSESLKALDERQQTAALNIVGVAAYAIHLLHWREDVIASPQKPSRQQRRASARSGGQPGVEYKQVHIGKWLKKYRAATQGGGGWDQRWHQVRGHSRTYTEDAPNFGCTRCKADGRGHGTRGEKSHVGVFWVGAHFAGDKNLGEIRHVYTVGAPE